MSTWTGNGDGQHWSDARNWSFHVPSTGANAFFSGGIRTVLLDPKAALTTGALNLSSTTVTLSQGRLNLAPKTASDGNTFDLTMIHKAHLTIAADASLIGGNVAQIGDGTPGTLLTVLGTVAEEYGIVRGGTLDVRGTSGHWLSGDSGLFLDSSSLVVEAGGQVDTGGKLAQYPAAALDMEGNSSGVVKGPGSVVNLANVFVSDQTGTSTLTVSSGGEIFTGGGQIGDDGDATLTVTGAGSLFSASRGLTIGGQVPVNSRLTITNHGAVKIGDYGLSLNGTLALDSTASFTSPSILSGGGIIQALSGAVKISSTLELSSNNTDTYSTKTTYLEASSGATLTIAGEIISAIPNDTSEVLDAASGHIVLSHTSDNFGGTTQLYAATLEIAAQDAAGVGALKFLGGADHPATLELDPGLIFKNLISGFGAGDTIDLAGLAFDHDSLGFAPAPSGGGVLTVGNGQGHSLSLSFGDPGLSAASFNLISDGHGGTALIHA